MIADIQIIIYILMFVGIVMNEYKKMAPIGAMRKEYISWIDAVL